VIFTLETDNGLKLAAIWCSMVFIFLPLSLCDISSGISTLVEVLLLDIELQI
jgi:hypothetical protein